uniref:glutathione transferase n=1 Tax=Kalanchoe fedtschenkoi TaxID=63787 RepID=A0A7N0T6Y8_KALFE
MALKLYGLPMSTCTARVLICLAEKEVDYELIPVNLFTDDHKQPAFLAKNPFGQIPVLQDADLTLFESRAITSYVAEKYKGSGSDLIRHADIKEAALVKVWMEVESQQFNLPISTITYQYLISPMLGKPTDHQLVEDNVAKLEKVLDVYEQRLTHAKYLAGDFFSLADLHHMSYIHYFLKTPKASLITDRPHVKDWWEDISARPAFTKISANMKYDF